MAQSISMFVVTLVAQLAASPWHHSYEEAVRAAEAEDKPVFIVFSASATMKLGDQEFVSPEVDQMLEDSYVRLFVNLDTERGQATARAFKALTSPYYVLLDRGGKYIMYRGPGHHTKDKIVELLDQNRDSEYNPVRQVSAVQPEAQSAGVSNASYEWNTRDCAT